MNSKGYFEAVAILRGRTWTPEEAEQLILLVRQGKKYFTKDYLLAESDFCNKELEKFYLNPIEENRQAVLNKREEFKLMYGGQGLTATM